MVFIDVFVYYKIDTRSEYIEEVTNGYNLYNLKLVKEVGLFSLIL